MTDKGLQQPKVSICIPTYNAANTLSDTMNSLLNQTYRNIEILIVDNASTDNTLAVAETYVEKDTRVILQSFDTNVGGEGNFTRCMHLASGKYTAIFHSDDVYEPDIVEKQVALLEAHADYAAVFTDASLIDDAGAMIGKRFFPPELSDMNEGALTFQGLFPLVLKYGNFITCPSVMVRTELNKTIVEKWDGQAYGSSADLGVWLKLSERHKLGFIREPLIRYRISEYSYSYHYKRNRNQQHDLFLVLDTYMDNFAKPFLTKKDYNNYGMLLVKDQVNRAISCVIRREDQEARRLLRPALSWKQLNVALRSAHHLKIYIFGIVTLILSYLPIGDAGRKLLFRVRYGSK